MKLIFKPYFFAVLALFLTCVSAHAQGAASVDEKLFESLHGHGSLNVVFTVIAIILLGLFITLWRLEKKVSKLEKEINKP